MRKRKIQLARALLFILIGSLAVARPLWAQGDVSFEDHSDFSVVGHPYAMAMRDLNGDGILDLVTANDLSHGVNVLLGNPDGSFQAAQFFSVGARSPLGVAIGDFNGDRIPDLATANRSSNSVSILLGNGDGTFGFAGEYAVGRSPQSVTVGDFNRDGILDLVVGNFYSTALEAPGYVSVLLGNGDGSFRRQDYEVGTNPEAVAVGDFNDDGYDDIAVACSGYQGRAVISILINNGNGTFADFQKYEVGSRCSFVAVGDFDDDGILDVAATNRTDDTISILFGQGDGTFDGGDTYPVGRSPRSVAVGDFDGDGILDLVTANERSNDITVLLGNGDGTFQDRKSFDAGRYSWFVVVGDFNRDGRPDVAVVNEGADTVSVFLNDSP